MPQQPDGAGAPPTAGCAASRWIWGFVILLVLALTFLGAVLAHGAALSGCTFLEKAAPYLLILVVLLFLVAFYPLQRLCGVEEEAATGRLKELGCLLLLEAIVISVVVPNMFGAVERGWQKRTMCDIRAVGTTLESYSKDHGRYPAADSIEDLAPFVEPTYIRRLPTQDAWRDRFWVWCDASSYTILSHGKCCEPDYEDLSNYPPGPTSHYTNDILFSNGEFVVYPEGAQN